MGNCIVLEEKVIKVMKTDGKIVEYKAPIKVEEVLAEFSGHAISDSFPEIRHLRSDFKLLGGNLYFLVPVPSPSRRKVVKKKVVRFSDEEAGGDDGAKEGGGGGVVVRIKLVIRKQELEELLQKGGVSVQDMVSLIQQIKQSAAAAADDDSSKGWKPELESIPEID